MSSHPLSQPLASPAAPRIPTDPVMTGFPSPAAETVTPDDPRDLLIRRAGQMCLAGGDGPGCPLDADTRLIAAAAGLVRRYPV